MILAAGKLCAGLPRHYLPPPRSGRNLQVGPQRHLCGGRSGLTQFMSGSWRELGLEANGNRSNRPTGPTDAIDA
jgi:hypothetical protein